MTKQSSISNEPNCEKDGPSPFFQAAQVSSVGIEMAVATVLGWGLGYWLDSKWETGPWLMLLGLLIGVAAGFKGLIRTANQVNCRQVQQANRLQEQRGSQNNLKEKLRREVI